MVIGDPIGNPRRDVRDLSGITKFEQLEIP